MKLKNTFTQGKMNKDIDERLLPKGQYPHAENVRVANSDASDIGSVENVKGNEKLTNFVLTNALTIGSFSDDSNQKIYWFTTSDEKDMVVEYDVHNKITTVLLESTKPNSLLNFNKNYLITGVVKIFNGDFNRDLIVWTDDLNPPRIINVERSKSYGVDGFTEDDISLIKKPPRFAPFVELTFTDSTLENNLENKFLSFAYRYRYLDGEYSALSSFSNYKFSPNPFNLDYQTMENNGMVNNFNALRINFNTGDTRVTDIEIVYKESNSNTVFLIERFNKEDEGWGNNLEESFTFFNSKKYAALSEEQLFRQFDNVPIRAKALDLIGSRIVFGNYVEGYDLTDISGNSVDVDYDILLISNELVGFNIPVVDFNNNGVNFTRLDFSNIELTEGARINFSLRYSNINDSGNSSVNTDFILNQSYDSLQDLLDDEDFIFFVEDILSNIFIDNLTIEDLDPDLEIVDVQGFEINNFNSTEIVLSNPIITYNNNAGTNETIESWVITDGSQTFFYTIGTASTLKTNRSYEVGIIYLDPYGRSTTVLTNANNTIYVPQIYSINQNKLQVNINNNPPSWADRYKIVVKQNQTNYETIYTNIFYEDGLFRWILLEGSNKDKVQEGDTLIVKSDLGGALETITTTRVLEVSTKDRNFIEENFNNEGDEIIEESGLYMKIKPSGFDMNNSGSTFRTFEGSTHLRYPTRTYTSPAFGEYDNTNTFTPFPLIAGSTVNIFIEFEARGKIEFKETYDRTFRVQADYSNMKDWFDAEVGDLGSFGRNNTWDGVTDIGGNVGCGGGTADSNRRFSGWGFGQTRDSNGSCTSALGEQFFVVPHREGTAARDITSTVRFTVSFSEGIVIFETEPTDTDEDIFYETEQTFEIIDNKHQGNLSNQDNLGSPAQIELDFFNAYVQGNGAESYKIRDNFNTASLNIDSRPTTTSVEEYKQIRRFADLTYSAPYNENSNVNGLNEFNLSLANFKEDIDKKYGFIQKLHSRDTDLIVFQEDKVSKVLFGKDLLLNADGTSNISSIEDVLGQQIPYTGEYGISRNPESFTYDGYHMYFTDVKRGAVMRLSNNGLTEISDYGLRQFFKDDFKNSITRKKLGGYDPYNDQYVLHSALQTISYDLNIDCTSSTTQTDFVGDFVVNIHYDNTVGDVGFSYDITDGVVDIKVEWDNTVVEELLNVSTSGNVVVNKPNISPSFIKVTISSSDCATYSIIGNCAVTDDLTVIPIILGDVSDEGKSIINRYRWTLGDYISNFKTYNTVFSSGELQTFDEFSGDEGIGNIPLTDSTIIMESLSGSNNLGVFEQGDRLGYFVSNVQYSESTYQSVIDNATFIPPTETTYSSGDVSNMISFIYDRPNNEQFLYLVYDYVRKNTAPVAVDDNSTVNRNEEVIINVLSNDSDNDGDNLQIIIEDNPLRGDVEVNGDGTITYINNGSSILTDIFTYYLTDGISVSNIATVNISVVNEPPVTSDDNVNVSLNASTIIQPLLNDTDGENDLLSVIIVSQPSFGTVVVNQDNTVTYTHNGTANLTDSFTYLVNDGIVDSNISTVNINVLNDPPVTLGDYASLSVGGSEIINLVDNDTDINNNTLTVIIQNNPVNGTVVNNNDGTVTYTHNGTANLTDSFTYLVNDGIVDSNISTVNIDIGVECDNNITFNGGQGIYSIDIIVGQHLGDISLNYDTLNLPERFQIVESSIVVSDSKYVGADLDANESSMIGNYLLPVYEYDYLTGQFFDTTNVELVDVTATDIADGSQSEPRNGVNSLIFNKGDVSPTILTLKVIAPLPNSTWSFTTECI